MIDMEPGGLEGGNGGTPATELGSVVQDALRRRNGIVLPRDALELYDVLRVIERERAGIAGDVGDDRRRVRRLREDPAHRMRERLDARAWVKERPHARVLLLGR